MHASEFPDPTPTETSIGVAGLLREECLEPEEDEEFHPSFCGAPKNAPKLSWLLLSALLIFCAAGGFWNLVLAQEVNYDGLTEAEIDSIVRNGWLPVALLISVPVSMCFSCIYTLYYEADDVPFYQAVYECRQRRVAFEEQKAFKKNIIKTLTREI